MGVPMWVGVKLEPELGWPVRKCAGPHVGRGESLHVIGAVSNIFTGGPSPL